MQTKTLENPSAEILPFNEVAEMIDREVHSRTLEQINFLAREYEIRNPQEVAAFLSENKSLIDLLGEIPAQIRKHFGAEQKLVLQFFVDPEDSTWQRIHLLVSTKLKHQEAKPLMDAFSEDWWLDNMRRADSKLLILRELIK
jgi:bifunctional DNA-binding transcriptional regulator/antitoxin component of YhaV-PrlF toxin-antitoxin module